MLMSLSETSLLIESGKWLHIAGSQALLGQLPKGNWIGGSTEYFMASSGGVVANDKFFVNEIPFSSCKVSVYDANSIENVTKDACENGFSVVILPFDSEVHKSYAKNASGYEDIFMKSIVGWVSGLNLSVPGLTPVVVNGLTGEIYCDKAVVLHVPVPSGRIVDIGIINIFNADESSPVIEFLEDSFAVKDCIVDGKRVNFSEYLAENNVDTKLPLVGEYFGNGINVSVKLIEQGVVNLYAPVFRDIKYRIANSISDSENECKRQLEAFRNTKSVFSCNCILNFLYGSLEGKSIDSFAGPITFGEIAYQLVNQTLVYLTISE